VPRFYPDGRLIVLGLLAGYFLLLALLTCILPLSVGDALKELGVPALEPHFGDLRNVAAGIQNQAAGHAVGDPNAFDPWHRPYIYPGPWLEARWLGFGPETVVTFGVAIIVVFYLSLYTILGKLTPLEGIFTGFFVISPALMTGVERCNINLVIFPLVGAALALRRSPAASGAFILLVSILKIHPIGALLAFFAPPWKKSIPWLAGLLGAFILYTLFNLKEFLVIASLAPHYPLFTFGSDVWGSWLAYAGIASGPLGRLITLGIGTLLLLAVGCAAVHFSPRLSPEPRWEWEAYSFRLGAGLMLAQFALGSNNDYGWMFFLFCLPLLFRLRAIEGPARRWTKAVLLLAFIYVNWDLFSEEYMLRHLLLKQPLAWALMGGLIGLLSTIRSWPIGWSEKR
jgi:hypothetical protein